MGLNFDYTIFFIVTFFFCSQLAHLQRYLLLQKMRCGYVCAKTQQFQTKSLVFVKSSIKIIDNMLHIDYTHIVTQGKQIFIVYVGLCANVVKYGSTLNIMFSVGYFFVLLASHFCGIYQLLLQKNTNCLHRGRK